MLNETHGALEEAFVSSAAKPPGRRVWKMRPETEQPFCAAIFLDGELYIERVSPPGFWVSVGNQETERGVSHPPSGMLQQTSQIEACRRGCDALRAAGYNVNHRVFEGRHDPERWREDLVLALPWVTSSA
jgi:hypothetical protein